LPNTGISQSLTFVHDGFQICDIVLYKIDAKLLSEIDKTGLFRFQTVDLDNISRHKVSISAGARFRNHRACSEGTRADSHLPGMQL
jgi:hypothetical protein